MNANNQWRCAAGIGPNEKRIREHLDGSLMLQTLGWNNARTTLALQALSRGAASLCSLALSLCPSQCRPGRCAEAGAASPSAPWSKPRLNVFNGRGVTP